MYVLKSWFDEKSFGETKSFIFQHCAVLLNSHVGLKENHKCICNSCKVNNEKIKYFKLHLSKAFQNIVLLTHISFEAK